MEPLQGPCQNLSVRVLETQRWFMEQYYLREVILRCTSTRACSNLPLEGWGRGYGRLLITAARCAESPEHMHILTDNGMLVRSLNRK